MYGGFHAWGRRDRTGKLPAWARGVEASRRGFDSACPSSVLRDSLLDADKSLQ